MRTDSSGVSYIRPSFEGRDDNALRDEIKSFLNDLSTAVTHQEKSTAATDFAERLYGVDPWKKVQRLADLSHKYSSKLYTGDWAGCVDLAGQIAEQTGGAFTVPPPTPLHLASPDYDSDSDSSGIHYHLQGHNTQTSQAYQPQQVMQSVPSHVQHMSMPPVSDQSNVTASPTNMINVYNQGSFVGLTNHPITSASAPCPPPLGPPSTFTGATPTANGSIQNQRSHVRSHAQHRRPKMPASQGPPSGISVGPMPSTNGSEQGQASHAAVTQGPVGSIPMPPPPHGPTASSVPAAGDWMSAQTERNERRRHRSNQVKSAKESATDVQQPTVQGFQAPSMVQTSVPTASVMWNPFHRALDPSRSLQAITNMSSGPPPPSSMPSGGVFGGLPPGYPGHPGDIVNSMASQARMQGLVY